VGLNSRDFRVLGILLLLGLVHGLAYVAIVPPWQHYDEPNHFEYIWLIVERGKLPEFGDYDQSMRRDVAESMIEHGFFEDLDYLPDLNTQDKPIWIGAFSQLANPPVYYLFAALPLKFLPLEDVTNQLYAARVISLIFYLATLFAAWGIASELTPTDHALRIFLPFSVALLPGFTDLMTSVNSDGAAVAFFSLFIWGSIRLIRSGFNLPNFLWTTAAMLLSIGTKETSFVALPLYFVVLLLAIFTGSRRWVAWSILVLGGVAGLVVVFTWGDAAFWARNTLQDAPTRIATSRAPLGNYALQIDYRDVDNPINRLQLHQLLDAEKAVELSGKTVTVGAWMWAERTVKVRSPMITVFDGAQVIYEEVEINEEPRYFAYTVELEGNTARAWLTLSPFLKKEKNPITVYYDGVLFIEGDYPTGETPQFANSRGSQGTWGGKSFENLLKNASAEIAWPQVRPWIDAIAAKYLPDHTRPSWIMAMITDWPGAGWYHQMTAFRLFRTFWGKFGWGHVPLLGRKPYRVIGVFTALGIIGAILASIRRRRTLNMGLLIFFFFTLLGVWGPSFVRGVNYIFLHPYFPVARYTYPVVILTMLVLNVGYLELAGYGERWLRMPSWGKYLLFLIFFGVLAIWSILSIIRFYSF
jgi:hypothetical protein